MSSFFNTEWQEHDPWLFFSTLAFMDSWTKQRLISHWILKQLLKDSRELFGNPYIIEPSGKLSIERNGNLYHFDASEFSVAYLRSRSKYSQKELADAINLLLSNNHIQREVETGPGIDGINIKVKPAGILAYSEQFYRKQINARKESWSKRNWILADTIKFSIGAIVGAIITAATIILLHNQRVAQAHMQQHPPSSQDSVSK